MMTEFAVSGSTYNAAWIIVVLVGYMHSFKQSISRHTYPFHAGDVQTLSRCMMERSNHHLLIGYTKTISSLILHLLAPSTCPMMTYMSCHVSMVLKTTELFIVIINHAHVTIVNLVPVHLLAILLGVAFAVKQVC